MYMSELYLRNMVSAHCRCALTQTKAKKQTETLNMLNDAWLFPVSIKKDNDFTSRVHYEEDSPDALSMRVSSKTGALTAGQRRPSSTLRPHPSAAPALASPVWAACSSSPTDVWESTALERQVEQATVKEMLRGRVQDPQNRSPQAPSPPVEETEHRRTFSPTAAGTGNASPLSC
ncbi:hypothetical protein H920_06920 [Fukomys damarensis]|uniref:Uncharacterized protein n=1 Tax=Fukomys damarensis TaxID=885580 RepID=A0A091E968_FUKDA|nr:hypothetical protein H920_06920 [Fukomys damarensis]